MAEPLELASVIGFAGSVPNGLIAHPDGKTIVYPLGSTIVLRSKDDSSRQEFLRGHSHEVRASDCAQTRTSGLHVARTASAAHRPAGLVPGDLALRQVPRVRPEDVHGLHRGHHRVGP